MSRAGRSVAAFLLLASTAGCAGLRAGTEGGGGRKTAVDAESGRREISVDAVGWAPIEGADTLSARHRALAEAQKKAVEKAVGVTVRASTRVDDAVSIKQSIEANMGGTIRRYEVTSESQEGGFFKVSIRAVVIYQPIDLGRPESAHSRLSVHIASERVAAAVRSALSSRDFELSESDADADVAVTGVVETRGLADPRLGGFYSYSAKVSLTAADLRSGKVTRSEFESSAVDPDEHAACDRALDKAGNEAGAALAATLANDAAPAVAVKPP
jgi:hypothetical protein